MTTALEATAPFVPPVSPAAPSGAASSTTASSGALGGVGGLSSPPPLGPGPGPNRRLLLALVTVTTLLLTVLPGPVGHAAEAAGHGSRDSVDADAGASASSGGGAGSGSGRVWPVGGPGGLVRRFEAPATPWAAGHRGVDLAATGGADIRSAAPGVVSFSGLVAGRPVVTVTHPASGSPPLRTTYLPVTGSLATGTTVTAGEVIGQLTPGAVHCAGHDCLHWGLLRGDWYLDPLALFGAGAARLLPLGRER